MRTSSEHLSVFPADDRPPGESVFPLRYRLPSRAPAIIHTLTLVVGSALLLYIGRRQWFVGDEWNILVNRGLHHPHIGIFRPHNEHWITTPILFYRALFSIFGLRTYIPYLALNLLFHAGAAHLLWRLMRSAGVSDWIATLLVGVFLFNGAGAENLTSAFQVTFVGTFFLGLVLAGLVDHDGPFGRRDLLAFLVGVVTLTFSGLAIVMVAVAGIIVWLRRGARHALVTTVPLAAVYGLWIALAGRYGLGTHDMTKRVLLALPEYAWNGLVATVDRSSVLSGAGPVVVLVLGYGLLRRAGRARTAAAPIFAAALGAVIFFLVVGLGRVAIAVDQSIASRYLYLTWGLLIPALGLLLHEFVGSDSVRFWAVFLLAAMTCVHGLDLLLASADQNGDAEQKLRRRLIAVSDLAGSGETVFPVPPEPRTAPDVTVDALLQFRRTGALVGSVDRADRLLAMGAVQVRVPAKLPVATRGGPEVKSIVGAHAQPGGGEGCLKIGPTANPSQVVFSLHVPAGLRLLPTEGGELHVLVRDNDGLTVDPAQTVVLQGGAEATVDLGITRAQTVMVLPAGEFTLCGVTSPG